MATSNIQKTGLEKAIYYIESIEDYEYDDLRKNLDTEKSDLSILLYDKDLKEYINFNFQIAINDCYYDWVYLTVNCNKDLEDYNLSKTSLNKIDKIISDLEKIMAKYSTKLKLIWRASNWETFYEKI